MEFEHSEETDWIKAGRAIEGAFVPASDEILLAALTKMESLCIRAREDVATAKVSLNSYIGELRKFPADIVLAALEEWPNRPSGKFAPSWSELVNGVKDKDNYWIFKGLNARCHKRNVLRGAFYFWKGKLNK